MDVVGRATQEAKAEDEGRCYAAGPHPDPRQPLPALLYLLHPCSRLPQGEGERRRALFCDRISNVVPKHYEVSYWAVNRCLLTG